MLPSSGAGMPTSQVFYTGVVPLSSAAQGGVNGLLNPVNTPQFNWDTQTAYNWASMTTVVTGSPASCTVVLEGSLDGSNWTTLATSNSTTGDTQFTNGLNPFTNLRARCTAVSGGTSPTVNVVACAYPSWPFPTASSNSLATSPFTPAPSNILINGVTAANTATAQTIITIPAGRTWYGTVWCSMYNGAATGTLVSALITTANSNITPSAGTNIMTVQAGTGGTVAGDVANQGTFGPFYVVAPGANTAKLTLTNSTATTCTSTASAAGILL